LYSLHARSTPPMLYTFSGALLVFAILKLHGMLSLSSCGNAYTDSVRSVCAVVRSAFSETLGIPELQDLQFRILGLGNGDCNPYTSVA